MMMLASGARFAMTASVCEGPLGRSETVEMDEMQASVGAQSAPASLLHPWTRPSEVSCFVLRDRARLCGGFTAGGVASR